LVKTAGPGTREMSVFYKASVKEVFPTPLWLLDLKLEAVSELKTHLLYRIEKNISPRSESNIGIPLQTDPILHELKSFSEFIGIVRSAVSAAFENLEIDHDGFEITGCWANINPTGSINSSHSHPNNYLSGVYYIQTPPKSGVIEFADPRSQAMAIAPPTKVQNKLNTNAIRLDIKPGRLVLFPAWLVHSVRVNQSEQDRVTISYNAMFTRFGEHMAKPLWQIGNVRLPIENS
jgi:uncharacterized protein (TIGR02466 family)